MASPPGASFVTLGQATFFFPLWLWHCREWRLSQDTPDWLTVALTGKGLSGSQRATWDSSCPSEAAEFIPSGRPFPAPASQADNAHLSPSPRASRHERLTENPHPARTRKILIQPRSKCQHLLSTYCVPAPVLGAEQTQPCPPDRRQVGIRFIWGILIASESWSQRKTQARF